MTVTVARVTTCANRQTTRSDRLATVRSLDERSKRYRSTPLFRPRVASTEPSMMGRTTWAMVIPARQARVGSGADTQELRGAVPALPNSHLARAEVWCQCRLSFPSGPWPRLICLVLTARRVRVPGTGAAPCIAAIVQSCAVSAVTCVGKAPARLALAGSVQSRCLRCESSGLGPGAP